AGRTGGLGAGSTLGRTQQSTDTGALEGRAGGAGGGGQPLLEGVRITADVAGNTLLIYASTEQYQIIARTLVQLDRPQLQVAIDATVAEVALNDNLSYGVQFYLNSKASGVPGAFSNIPQATPNGPGVPSTVNAKDVSSPFSTSGLVGAALSR